MSGKAIILCAPSGSGKTTLAKFLLSNKDLNLKFSVSATTREIRKNETNYIDYNFLDVNTFKNKIMSQVWQICRFIKACTIICGV